MMADKATWVTAFAHGARRHIAHRILLALLSGTLFIGLAPWATHPVAAAAGTDTLNTNETLNARQLLRSPSGRYQAEMQTDGNLVVYENPGHIARKWTGTRTSKPGMGVLVNQGNGHASPYDV